MRRDGRKTKIGERLGLGVFVFPSFNDTGFSKFLGFLFAFFFWKAFLSRGRTNGGVLQMGSDYCSLGWKIQE